MDNEREQVAFTNAVLAILLAIALATAIQEMGVFPWYVEILLIVPIFAAIALLYIRTRRGRSKER